MITKAFWTDKRLEALSKTCLTLFQAFLIAAAIGGIFDKIHGIWAKMFFVAATLAFFIVGISLSDRLTRKEA